MDGKVLINVRVTIQEAAILSDYAEMLRQTQTDVVRGFIRSLEPKVRTVTPDNVQPFLLPSLPLTKRPLFPPVSAIYFFITEAGEVLYVGESDDLSLRCLSHIRHREALEVDPHARMHWLEMRGDKRKRVKFERACIRRFNPPLNRQVY